MASCESNQSSESPTEINRVELGITDSHFLVPDEDKKLVQAFQNVEYGDKVLFDFDSMKLPIRYGVEDCYYYMRTGICKFELNCRFNHPIGKGGKEKMKTHEELLENTSRIKCKYYLSAGGCKFGSVCKYDHPKENIAIAESDFNSLGLPIRLGERECPFFKQSGFCGYGINCWFHHPNPTSIEESNSLKTLTHSHWSKASRPNDVPTPYHLTMHNMVPYNLSYLPTIHPPPQAAVTGLEGNVYQAPIYSHERSSYLTKRPGVSIYQSQQTQMNEFPERHGEPECTYFLKTGYCKFKSACRYHHPKGRAVNFHVGDVRNSNVPLRPGRKICWHYERTGACKFGNACLFDHRVNSLNSASLGQADMAVTENKGV